MPQLDANALCPRGHQSVDLDYCSECGTRMPANSASEQGAGSPMPSSATPAGETCPDCATVREQPEITFCEVCGFNYQTGARGEIPGVLDISSASAVETSSPTAVPSPPATLSDATQDESPAATEPTQAAQAETPTAPVMWRLVVEVDPTLRKEESPAAPSAFVPFAVDLTNPSTLLGRRDEARGISPDIALSHDEAVSRRHALFLFDAASGQLVLRDIGASNGTRLNGLDVAPMSDQVLQNGDQITLGHWSRLRVQHG